MNKKKNTCKCVAFILVTILLVLGISESMKATEASSVVSIKGFYQEEQNSLDVVVIGSSEVYTGYLPTEAYEKYGYTSYSLSSPGMSGDLYQTMLMEVLKTQSPKVVAFEVNGFIHGDDYFHKSAAHHNVIDNLRISQNWVNAIENFTEEDEKMSYYFPIATYHSNYGLWRRMCHNVLAKVMIATNGPTTLKGISTFSYSDNIEKLKKRGKIQFTEESEKYLRQLLELCQEQGVERVVFFRSPHAFKPKKAGELNKIWEIVEEYGYDAVNFDEDIKSLGIDKNKDFYNVEHLNIYGAEKFTEVFGKYLSENYDLSGAHNEKIVKQWDESVVLADKLFKDIKADIENEELYKYSEIAFYGGKIPVDIKDVTLK